MSALVSIALFSVTGYAIVSRFLRLRWELAAATSFLVGSGWASLVLLAISISGMRWSVILVASLLLLPLACFFLPAPTGDEKGDVRARSDRLHLLFDFALVVIIAGYGVYSIAATPSKWDFWAIWGLKARVFFEYGGVDWTFLRNADNLFVNPDYPLLVPLVYDVPAVLGGHWSDAWLGLVGVAYSVSIILIVRGLAVEELRSTSAASLLAIGASGFALSVYVGLAEVPLIAYDAGGLLLLRRAVASNDARLMRLAAVLIGFGALTKNEGIAAVIMIAVALCVATQSVRRLIDYSPAFGAVALWTVVRAAESLPSYYLASGTLLKQLERHAHQLSTIAAAMRATPPEKPFFWLTVAIILPFAVRLVVRQERLVALATLLQLLAFLAVYAVTSHPVEWQISTSWPRLLNQIAIPVLYVAFVRLLLPGDGGRSTGASDESLEVRS